MAVCRADSQGIERAAACLRAGGLVAFPTETVYGLGADATNAMATARIFEAKGRPTFNPLIVHVASIEAAAALAELTDLARTLAHTFWPGGLTLVLERRPQSGLCDLVSAGLTSVALRVPAHPVAQALITAAGRPVAAPSANRSGHVSATSARHVADDLGCRVDLILDDGPSPLGLESTIIDARGPNPILLRPGAVPVEAIQTATGTVVSAGSQASDGLTPRTSPGQLESHYAPSCPVRLNVRQAQPGEALLAFGPDVPKHDGPTINLSASGDLTEAAARLFEALRQLDRGCATGIAVMPIPETGLGRAINDRLRRAAAPRV